jgi:hypothetical protein
LTSPTDRDRSAIYAAYGLTCPPRFATLRNPDRPTYGGKIAKLAAALGTPLMPWQRYTADTSLEIDPGTGLFVYRGIGCTVPRQSGKTSLILPVACHRAMAWQNQRIRYAAQSGTEARQKWEDDQLPALEAAKFIPNRARARKANGREAIIWKATKSIHSLHNNTEKSGHGKTLHLGLLDEYFAQVDYRIHAAWGPAMITVLMAQFWWFSTMGTSKSVPMNADVARGRELVDAGAPTRTAYFDWSAPPDADYRDPKTWLACMPALCPTPPPCRCSPHWRHTVTIGAIQAELENASTREKLAEFLRAYLNWPVEDDDVEADPNVPTLAEWNLLANAAAKGGDVVAIAIDVTPLRDHAAIVATGDGPDGLPRVAVLDHGPGISWLMPRILQLREQLNPVAWSLDDKSGANTLIVPMEQNGITRMGKEPHRGGLWIPTVPELGATCATFADRVRAAGLIHLGQEQLTLALAGARTRPLGDGSWAWGRKLGSSDISPLVGGSLSLGAYERFRHLAYSTYDPLANIG